MTPLEQTRLLIPDTAEPRIFSDEELLFFLSEHNNNPRLAAAEAIEIIAGDPQRVAAYSRGGVSVTKATAAELQARAQQLRLDAHGGIVVGTMKRSDFWE